MPYNPRGFTLVELIIVVVLIGVISAVALPHFMDVSEDTYLANFKTTRAVFMTGVATMHGQYMVNQDTQGITTWSDNYPDLRANTTTSAMCVTLWDAAVTGNVHAWALSDSSVMSDGDYAAFALGPMTSGNYACVYAYSSTATGGFSPIPQVVYDNARHFIIYTSQGIVDFLDTSVSSLAAYEAAH